MLRTMTAAAALAVSLAAPASAAEIAAFRETGTPQRSAFAGVYLKVPLSSARGNAAPHAGLRVSVVHDRRDAAGAPIASVSRDALDLRFGADAKPALYLAGAPLAGPGSERLHGLGTGETIAVAAGAVVVAAVVGLLVLRSELAEDE